MSAADYVVLIVEDLDASLRFWTDLLGLSLGHRSGPYAQLDTGTTRLALYQRDAMAATLGRPLQPPAPEAPGFEVGFKVPDVDAAYQELVAGGARPVRPPADQPWGQRTAYVADPDGHLVELVCANPRT
ncbi:MAG: VOC family protein [Acidimicrobiia bacterium]